MRRTGETATRGAYDHDPSRAPDARGAERGGSRKHGRPREGFLASALVRGGVATALVGGLLLAAGCARFSRAEPRSEGRFGPLRQGDLSAFEHRIAVENHTGADGAWTRVAEAWLALANCKPVRAEAFPDPAEAPQVPAYVHATLVLEDVRRRLRAATLAAGEFLPPGEVIFDKIGAPDFFDRDPPDLAPKTIEWPAEEESWGDEVPAPVHVHSRCDRLDRRVYAPSKTDRSDGTSEASEKGPRARTVAGWRAELFRAVDRVIERYERLPDAQHSGGLAASHLRARAYGAESAFRFSRIYETRDVPEIEGDDASRPSLAPADLWDRIARYVEPLAQNSTVAGLPGQRRGHAHLLAALFRERNDETGLALSHLTEALEIGLDDRNRWPVRYLRVRLLTQEGRWEEAAGLADRLPPRDSRYFASYAYRTAFAARQAGQDDRFLGIAKEVFRDRTPESGPFERALYTDVLRTLASYDFEERTVELLEELGPRSELYERIEQLARVALERGRPENAEEAARWLLDHHTDSRFEPRYRGILAMGAFLRDAPEEFREHIGDIARRPEALLEAIPKRRRASFFAHTDAELARILRQILPMMAEWGDTAAGRKRRKKWLEIVVEQTQDFLRSTEASVARSELLELYRLASGLLDDHPRGYAERVGSSGETPLVLGTVRVRKPNLERHEPVVWATFPAPYLLTPVPKDDEPPTSWALEWPEDEEGEDA